MLLTKRQLARRDEFSFRVGDHSISDPYRWLEEESNEREAWVAAQHAESMTQLSALPLRERIHSRLDELLRKQISKNVLRVGGRSFFRRRVANQDLAVLFCQDAADQTPRLLLDPNELSVDGSITLADIHPSADGVLIAYRLSAAGSSGMSLHVMDVVSGKLLPEVIPGEVNPVAHAWHTKNRVAWLPDNSGFYYTRSPHNVQGGESRFHHKLYFHRLGDDWRDDELVFGNSLKREQTPYPQISVDGRYLLALVQDLSGTAPRSGVCLLDRAGPDNEFVRLVEDLDAFMSVALHRDKLYLRIDHEAGKILSLDLLDQRLKTVITETANSIGAWVLAGNYLFVETIESVSSRLRIYDLAGEFIKQFDLPDRGCINSLDASAEEVVISFSSLLVPPTDYRVNLKTLELVGTGGQGSGVAVRSAEDEVLRRSTTLNSPHPDPCPLPPDPYPDFVVEQHWFESRDSTKVPMFLVHKRGIKRDGNNATVVHGYGGFGVKVMPKFTAHVIPFLECGGVYAIVNTRGGGELGTHWHRAGMRAGKQNVFDDFNGAAEWLIERGYTRPSKLGCFGWSNGGLTVIAAAVQRPELWQAVVAGAPVTDLARFHLAHGGQHWVAEYGSPEVPADLEFLMQYSPYHTLPNEFASPAVLLIAPDNDDRVAPWHSYKMHASLLAANVSQSPILLRRESRAGHHGNQGVTTTLDRNADIWSFFFWQLGIEDRT